METGFFPTLFGRFTAFFSEYESDIALSFFETPISFGNQVRDLTFGADIDYFASARHTIKSGLQLSRYAFDFASSFNRQSQFSLETNPLLLSAYVQDDWQITPLTDLRLGLRSSFFSEGNRTLLEPRFSLSRTLQPGWRAKLAGGLYHQYLQLVTSEGFSGGDFWVPLDESVPLVVLGSSLPACSGAPPALSNEHRSAFIRTWKIWWSSTTTA